MNLKRCWGHNMFCPRLFLLILFVSQLMSTTWAATKKAEINPVIVNSETTFEIKSEKKSLPISQNIKNYSPLAQKFFKAKGKEDLKKLGQEVLAIGPKSAPDLITVMKDGAYPMESRWVATLLLARTMGKKSTSFLAKFIEHPHYMLRMASLKAMMGLQVKDNLGVYRKALKDPSLMVRVQALDNISSLQINELGPEVWEMLLDKKNYQGENGKMRRSIVIKKAIRTLGDINFRPAVVTLGKLIQRSRYEDVFGDLEYGLEKLTGKKSPAGDQVAKRKFWSLAI